ncbi:MAG: DUF6519 domain-containing protein [Alphaproteobacteria bacterium]
MTGDYTRFTHRPERRYAEVLMQQGRVTLDADWNEQAAIVTRQMRLQALDTFGPAAVAWLNTPDAFLIAPLAGPPADFSIGPGRLYLDGLLAEAFAAEAPTYLSQPFLPDPPPLPAAGSVIVYLDLWQREVTYVQDPALLEKALGGPDTTTRIQRVWQVKWTAVEGEAACGTDLDALFPPSAGRLSTAAFAPPPSGDPCILSPTGGYRGLENRLYRVEVHTPGPLGTARFKWSRDNASIVSPVTAVATSGSDTVLTVGRIGRDRVLRFRADDWVTVTDDHRELMGEPGEMARIVDTDEAAQTITLDRALPSGGGRPFGGDAAELAARHTRVQRWDQNASNAAIDADGLIDTAAGPIPIEDGIEITFSTDPAGGGFRLGDYWLFAARTADASVEILTDAPPRGIEHHYLQVGVLAGLGGGAPTTQDCRPRPRDCACCCTVTVGSLQNPAGDYQTLEAAVAALPGIAPDAEVHVAICLAPGDHAVDAPVVIERPRVRITGCGPTSRLRVERGPGLLLRGAAASAQAFAMVGENEAPLILLQGQGQRLNDLDLENHGPGPAVAAEGVDDLVVADCGARGVGGIELAGDRIVVTGCRVEGGPVRVGAGSDTVRIEDNDLIGSASSGILVGGREPSYEIDLLRNRIRGAAGNGLTSGHFDPEGIADGIVMGLRVVGNEIVECAAARADGQDADRPLGGIVLGRVYDLLIRDNRIERNGEDARAAVCGIFVRHSRGLEIAGNLLRDNGPPGDGGLLPGPQAGIMLRDASILAATMPGDTTTDRPRGAGFRLGALPAARIDGNTVEARRGPALWIRGMGPMAVRGNHLSAMDVLADLGDDVEDGIDAYVGGVFLLNLGLPGYFAGWLSALGFNGLREGMAVEGQPVARFVLGGQVQYAGNRMRLDLTRPDTQIALANTLIFSLDDTGVADNQSEGVLGLDLLLADLLNVAISTRVTGNGLMSTPLLTAFSIMAFGLVAHCTNNQATSCIRAFGMSPQSFVGNNAVIWPHPQFCPEGAFSG